MDEKQQRECHLLIKKYKELKREATKAKYRNRIHTMMNDFMLIQIKVILNRWKKYITGDELLSISWDAFLFCLNHYNPEKFSSPIPHFYIYIK